MSIDVPTSTVPSCLLEGRYVVKQELAQGGMGKVYLVHDVELERDVALKVLRPEVASDTGFVAAFVEEARALGQLEHPGVMPIYDIGLGDDGTLFFTMKYMQGCTLANLITRLQNGEAHMPFTDRVDVVLAMAEAVSFAHARGVLHRDIKPDNVMVGPFGQVTVMDWGLAKRRHRRAAAAARHTRIAHLAESPSLDTMLAGTPGYMPPETLRDAEGYHERSDLYSLGVVMYELLTLQMPFSGRSGIQAVVASMNEEPMPADAVVSPHQGRVPKELALIVRKAMARNPADRYDDVRAFITAIERYRQGQAPVVCAHTGLKRLINRLADLVDDHGHAVIVTLIAVVSTSVLALVACLCR